MIVQTGIKEALIRFTKETGKPFHLKSIFFDMDGVLFDSMPHHAKAWLETFEEHGFPIPEEEPYLNEGSTALFTVRKMYKKYRNEDISEEQAEKYKVRKHQLMEAYPPSEVMPYMKELLDSITSIGIDCWVVTGSAQSILLDRLQEEYKGSLSRGKMVTAHDVSIGKPHPEPYLKAMAKSGYDPSQAIVVENAPMGVESAKAAGLFVIAINTGPLDPKVLADAGADIVFSGSRELSEAWPIIHKSITAY